MALATLGAGVNNSMESTMDTEIALDVCGSSLHEARGSELAPNALEYDGGGIGIRAPCAATTRGSTSTTTSAWCDERHCAETISSSLGAQTVGLGVCNTRVGREWAVDHSEQCRCRMEALLATTST